MTLVRSGTGVAPGVAAAPQMKPQDFQRVVELINKFTLNTVHLMNRFATYSDERLATVARTLYRVECQVALLEHKLDSVEAASAVRPKVDKPAAAPVAAAAVPKITAGVPPGFPATKQPPPMPARQQRGALPAPPGATSRPPLPGLTAPLCLSAAPRPGGILPPPPPMPIAAGLQVKTHPRLRGYFVMLDRGVDVVAVKAKMTADGFDPAWLDTPDAPSPLPATGPKAKDEDSD